MEAEEQPADEEEEPVVPEGESHQAVLLRAAGLEARLAGLELILAAAQARVHELELGKAADTDAVKVARLRQQMTQYINDLMYWKTAHGNEYPARRIEEVTKFLQEIDAL